MTDREKYLVRTAKEAVKKLYTTDPRIAAVMVDGARTTLLAYLKEHHFPEHIYFTGFHEGMGMMLFMILAGKLDITMIEKDEK